MKSLLSCENIDFPVADHYYQPPKLMTTGIVPIIHSHYPRLGDLPGQQRLRQAWHKYEEDKDIPSFRSVQESLANELISEQEEAGLQIVSDGLVRWYDSVSHFMGSFGGVETGGLLRYFDTNTYFRQPNIVDELVWGQSLFKDEWSHLLKNTQQRVKLVVTGPYTLAALSCLNKSVDAATFGDYVETIAKGLSYEIGGLSSISSLKDRIGMIQIDEPYLLQKPQDFPLLKSALETIRANTSASLYMTLTTFFGDAAPCYKQLQQLPDAENVKDTLP
jgi:5-methyltetrahydropteroyltriglutamate--homocysteine methyltransferase